MLTSIMQVLFGNRNGHIPPPGFFAPLTSSAILERGVGSPTFTRATTAYVTDFEGLAKNCKSGEIRFTGARRVENLLLKTESFDSAPWATSGSCTVTADTAIAPNGQQTADTLSFPAGGNQRLQSTTGIIGHTYVWSVWVKGTNGTFFTKIYNGAADVNGTLLTATNAWQRFSVQFTQITSTTQNVAIMSNGTFDFFVWGAQLEDVTGQSNQNPSEYVSAGVLSSPYQGAMVDGVQYFPYQNGNTVASNVVTAGQGPAIALATLKGYLAEPAATQLVTPTASIRDMTDASWVKTTMSAAKTATGIDGVANSASTITASGASATILQTLTAAASSRTYSAYVKRRTGTGTILMKQGATTLDITASINSSTYTLVQLNASVLNVAFGFQINTSGDAIDVDFNQFEAGAFATSPMATAGAARNADVLTYPTSSNFSDTSGTMYAETQQTSWPNAAGSIIGSATQGLMPLATQSGIKAFDGTNTVNGPAGSPSGMVKMGATWGTGMSVDASGGTVSTGSYDGAWNLATIGIGTSGNGNVRNVRIWQTQLSNLRLQSMTQ